MEQPTKTPEQRIKELEITVLALQDLCNTRAQEVLDGLVAKKGFEVKANEALQEAAMLNFQLDQALQENAALKAELESRPAAVEEVEIIEGSATVTDDEPKKH